MVKQVLTFGRGAEGKTVVHFNHLLREMERIIRDVFPKSIQARIKIAPKLWHVSGHATQLHQVLMNLCINARDAMPDGGQLTLSAENLAPEKMRAHAPPGIAPGPYLLIVVADTGIGMSPELLEKIFQPFFTTKDPGKGTGLGLSTSLNIVKSHGGFMTVKSQPGKGTEFNVFLQATVAPAEEVSAPRRPILPSGHGELILVIDDETAICGITRATLENCGYRVLVAAGGSEALAIFAEKHAEIALAVTDMSMPFMDGRAICRALRNLNPSIKIIVASGSDPRHETPELPVPVNAFIQKPYTAETLIVAVHNVLTKSRA